jgi:hypothetical protein
LLNLIPVWILDGSQAAYALSRVQRFLLLTCLLFAWITGDVALPFVGAELVYRLFTKDLPGEPHANDGLLHGLLFALGGLLKVTLLLPRF